MRSYKSPSRVIIGLCPSSTVMQLIFCACCKIVRSICHSVGLLLYNGATIPTFHTGVLSCIKELKVDHVGDLWHLSGSFLHVLLLVLSVEEIWGSLEAECCGSMLWHRWFTWGWSDILVCRDHYSLIGFFWFMEARSNFSQRICIFWRNVNLSPTICATRELHINNQIMSHCV